MLLVAETLYLAARLPETRGWIQASDSTDVNGSAEGKLRVKETAEKRLARLSAIGQLHGFFLLFFSGVS